MHIMILCWKRIHNIWCCDRRPNEPLCSRSVESICRLSVIDWQLFLPDHVDTKKKFTSFGRLFMRVSFTVAPSRRSNDFNVWSVNRFLITVCVLKGTLTLWKVFTSGKGFLNLFKNSSSLHLILERIESL